MECTEIVMNEAKLLLKAVYGFGEDALIGDMRAQKFLTSKSLLLKTLPPTESAFEHHVKRAAFATIIDKTAHIGQPTLPLATDYGWALATMAEEG